MYEPLDDWDEIGEQADGTSLTDHADMDNARRPMVTAAAEPPAVVVTLDPLQQQAITDAHDHLFTNISGTAGVGKTHVAREIQRRQPGVVLAATTGIASVNLGEGTTINALLRYFDTKSLEQSYLEGTLRAQLNKLRRSGVQRILIDEKSMLSGQQLTPIARAVREVNEGGVYALEDVGAGDDEGYDPQYSRSRADLPPLGLTLIGDFGQLPPVPDEDPQTGKKIPIQFAFDSPEWANFADHTTTLTTIYRQDAQDFVGALHAIRKAHVTQALDFFTPARFSSTMDDDFDGTTIFAKNDQVDRYNLMRLDRIAGKPVTYTTRRSGKPRGDWRQIPDTLRVKEGALVMILANRREYEDEFDERGRLIYANGDLATLLEQDGAVGWRARLHRTGAIVRIYPIRRENTIPLETGRRKELKAMVANGTGRTAAFPFLSIEDVITEQGKGRSEIVGAVEYMPVRAAYGCTVHKTQGLTLDNVQVNINDYFFKQPGMLFVALSRARTAEGLRIVGSQRAFIERCRVDPRVQKWL